MIIPIDISMKMAWYDFRVLNLQDETRTDYVDILLLGNLLSFYEQLRLYEEHQDELRPYNLEKPLWVFVGGTVNAVYNENKRKRSDVLTVVHFLHKVLRDRGWATKSMEKLLNGQSGLKDPYGVDVFSNRFKYLNERKPREGQGQMETYIAALYNDIMARVFNAPTGGGLHLAFIRGNQGEIGLKSSNGEHYFGLIYIGDTSKFKKLLEENAPEITIEEDVIGPSLFNDINRSDSRINVLIGAKIHRGWNSWRVSNMGLLNIGRSEGAQIIQLFGRGVRLKGKNMSLKRSAALDGPHPKHITILETLNIFAVRANYMAQFREYLEREGVDIESVIELPLFIKVTESALKEDLVIPRIPEGRDFESNQRFVLRADETIKVHVDMSLKVQIMTSNINKLHQAVVGQKKEEIPPESLTLVDWEKVYLDLLEYKVIKGWHNLILLPETPYQLMEQIKYELITDDDTVNQRI